MAEGQNVYLIRQIDCDEADTIFGVFSSEEQVAEFVKQYGVQRGSEVAGWLDVQIVPLDSFACVSGLHAYRVTREVFDDLPRDSPNLIDAYFIDGEIKPEMQDTRVRCEPWHSWHVRRTWVIAETYADAVRIGDERIQQFMSRRERG